MDVYKSCAKICRENPNAATGFTVEQLKTVASKYPDLSEPIKQIIFNKTMEQKCCSINKDKKTFLQLSKDSQKGLLVWTEKNYYDGENKYQILLDDVYDYCKRVYNKSRLKTEDELILMKTVSSSTGVGHSSSRNTVKLPVYLGSLNNIFHGNGDVKKWSSKYTRGFTVSAKLDGVSALFYKGRLYTRGDSVNGRDISWMIPYLKFGGLDIVRGEIVMSKSNFSKIKDDTKKINRNVVSGIVNSVDHDTSLAKLLDFVAYEIIGEYRKLQENPSAQFEKLKKSGYNTVWNRQISEVTDNNLSISYMDLRTDYCYEIDGVVVTADEPYERSVGKNPSYSKAFKKLLEDDTRITEIISVEWNVSPDGYIFPTLTYEPIVISGRKLNRCSGHNAKYVIENGIGPGAKVLIAYWAGVIPKVCNVLERSETNMPSMEHTWDETKTHLVTVKRSTEQDIRIIYKFITEIKAKDIGRATVERIFNQEACRTIEDFINIEEKHTSFLGKVKGLKVVASIRDAMSKVNLPVLMSASKCFERGIGYKKLEPIFEKYSASDILSDKDIDFTCIRGLGKQSAEKVSKGLVEFRKFFKKLPANIQKNLTEESPSEPPISSEHGMFTGKNCVMTGFRSESLVLKLERCGANMKSTVTGKTDFLFVPYSGYTNSKTAKATNYNVTILTKEELNTMI